MNSTVKQGFSVLLLMALFASLNGYGQERKAYKHVDKAGNITYSQTPPVDGKEAKKVDIAPAQQGRGGNAGGYSPYDGRSQSNSYANSGNRSTPRQPTAQEQRMAALQTECLRQRGTDCDNPATLQYMDSTSIPRRGR